MKELKFRFACQDLAGNTFLLYYRIDEFINGLNLARNGRIEKILSKDVFIGLKDKNNKEIYEGDILGANGRWFKLIIIYSIKKGGFVIKNMSPERLVSEYIIENPEFEIIGNIYENPEMV